MYSALPGFLFLAFALAAACSAIAHTIDAPLSGLELRCCTIVEAPVVQRDNETIEHYSGIAIEYLRQLELSLGFRCHTLDEFTTQDGALLTFTGAVRHMQACENGTAPQEDCACDLGVGGWSLTEERLGAVDFVQPFAYDYYRVITHANNTVHPVGNVFFFSAFETPVWLAVLVLLLLCSTLRMLDARFGASENGNGAWAEQPGEEFSNARRMSERAKPLAVVWRTWNALASTYWYILGESERDESVLKPSWRRVPLNALVFLSGLFLVLTYSAVMTNLLLNEKRVSKLKGLKHFQDCVIPADEVCITSGSGAQSFWEHAVANRNCHYQKDAPRAVTRETFDDSFDAFLSGECSYMVGLGFELQHLARGAHCASVRLTGNPFRDTDISFILPRGSNLTAMLSNATLALRGADVIPGARDYVARSGSCGANDAVSIPFRKIVLFVLTVLFGSAVVLALSLCARWRALPQENDDLF